MMFSCDFETTTKIDDCRVWLWAVMDINNTDDMHIGKDIESFFEFMSKTSGTYYFHNLAFDGEFILNHLLRIGYLYTPRDYVTNYEFSWLMSKMGKVYKMEIGFPHHKVVIKDSLKKLPFSVATVSKAFGLEDIKGDIDYELERPVGWEPTDEEIDYIRRDVKIVADALRQQMSEGLTGLTVGADALSSYKRMNKRFKKMFPTIDKPTDAAIRKAYRGGYTYVKEEIKGKRIGEGMVFDVNSLYPHVMYSFPMPHGNPVIFGGRYDVNSEYPLYVQRFRCMLKLKPKRVPIISIKNTPGFAASEYLTELNEPLELTLSNVDLDMLFEHYDVDILEYSGGFMFHAIEGPFNDYINYWTAVKEENEGGRRTLAKLMLNSLYGKFGTSTDVTGKYPILEDGRVRYVMGPDAEREPVYTPVAVFTTSWARYVTISTLQSVYDRFLYCDTDSIHITGTELPDIDIHPTHRGAWKHEANFSEAVFVRAKTYAENVCWTPKDGVIDPPRFEATCAGLSDKGKSFVTMDNFRQGLHIEQGKLLPQHVPGGIVLEWRPFTLL